MKRFSLLSFIFFISCATIPYPYKTKTPELPVRIIDSEWDGKELVFCQTNQSYQKYFSSSGWKAINGYFPLQYEKLVGKKGLVEGMLIDKRGYKFWVVNLNDGAKIIKKDEDELKWGFIDKTCFVDELVKATELINKYIWLNKIKDSDYPMGEKPYIYSNIFNDEANQWTTFKRLQKVKVLEAIPFNYGNSYKGNPIFLKIIGDDGETGFIRYGRTKYGIQSRLVHYYDHNPINEEWGQKIIDKILNGKIEIGMTTSQVKVSWGEPDDINITLTVYSRNEQWIYGTDSRYSKYYLYFDDGILTSFQQF